MAISTCKARSADHRLDAARVDFQMADRAVAHIGASARQAVVVIGKRLEMLAPPLAPEAARDGAPVDLDGLDVLALLAQLVHLLLGLGAALGHGT